jgi:hypothetical protein
MRRSPRRSGDWPRIRLTPRSAKPWRLTWTPCRLTGRSDSGRLTRSGAGQSLLPDFLELELELDSDFEPLELESELELESDFELDSDLEPDSDFDEPLSLSLLAFSAAISRERRRVP